jgi:DNA-binding winged helix-turn-helix (wHTH) protein
MRLAFDTFVLDLDQRRLLKDGVDVHLQPKAFELLRVLVEARPKALSKQEILDAVWPGVFVGENNLATVVRDLRTALDDDAQTPHYIRTAYGYGYAFAAAAATVGAPLTPLPSAWRLIHDHREIVLIEGRTILGRAGPDVVAPPRRHRDSRRSRHHRGPRQQERHANRQRRGHRGRATGRRRRDPPRLGAAGAAAASRRGDHRYGVSSPRPHASSPRRQDSSGAAVTPSRPWRPR